MILPDDAKDMARGQDGAYLVVQALRLPPGGGRFGWCDGHGAM
jgi:hypothetical protein